MKRNLLGLLFGFMAVGTGVYIVHAESSPKVMSELQYAKLDAAMANKQAVVLDAQARVNTLIAPYNAVINEICVSNGIKPEELGVKVCIDGATRIIHACDKPVAATASLPDMAPPPAKKK